MTYTGIKQRAKESLKGKFYIMSLINFLYNFIISIFGIVISIGLIGALFGVVYNIAADKLVIDWEKEIDAASRTILENAYGKELIEQIGTIFLNMCKACSEMVGVLVAISVIGFILLVVVGSVITAGIHNCYYKVATGEEVRVRDMFSNARLWPKMLGINILRYGAVYVTYIGACMLVAMLFPALASVLLLVILFITVMVLLEFMFAPIILTNDTNKGVIQCMKEATNLMKNIRFKMFGFTVSFIGWGLLVWLVSVIFAYILPILGTVAISMLQVYYWVSYVHFYLHLTGQDDYIETYNTNYYNYQTNQFGDLNNNGVSQFGNGQNNQINNAPVSQFGRTQTNQVDNNMTSQSNTMDDLELQAEKLSSMNDELELKLEDDTLDLELEDDMIELELEDDSIDLE